MNLKQEENLIKIKQIANNVKTLALDMITHANSGHPGIVLSAANFLTVLFQNHLKVDPYHLHFFNKDRFIMGAGHGSALLYALMVCFGYNSLTIEDLKQFRSLNSKTPGHPESNVTLGVDYSTGPLGQGSAAAVGMAIAETHLAKLYNQYVNNLIDHYTYCFISDGCFEEGINYEALSIAGKYQLNKLIFLYDSNHIQLDGTVSSNTVTNTKQYFESLGLNYIYVEDGFDFNAIDEAINLAKQSLDKATVIEFNTILGKDSVYENTNKSHGTVLTEQQVLEYKRKIEWDFPSFSLLQSVINDTNEFKQRGHIAYENFITNMQLLYKTNPFAFESLNNIMSMNFNFKIDDFKQLINDVSLSDKHSTRELCGLVLQQILFLNPSFMITNPDLSSSTKIKKNSDGNYDKNHEEYCNINVGVREFAAMGIINGMTAHQGLKGITAAFLSFSDYNKAAIRIAALSHYPTISFFSHDSIAVGEDGPSHQPIEQVNALRLIPNTYVFRPCNVDEVISCLKISTLNKQTPSCIITSRQAFKNYYSNNLLDIDKGGYIFEDDAKVQIILIATGSEIQTAIEAKRIIQSQVDLGIRIVSMPCAQIFEEQTEEYKNKVLSLDKKYIFSIELGSTSFWYKYSNHPIGIDEFGLSGKQEALMDHFSFSPFEIAKKIMTILNKMVSDFAKLKESI